MIRLAVFCVSILIFHSVCYSTADQCGVKGSRRVVGGTEAGPGEIPWQVGLLDTTLNWATAGVKPKSFVCGGTLIHPKWVLTAAHCFDYERGRFSDTNPKHKQIRVGSWHRNVVDKTEKDLSVKTIIIHPKYWSGKFTVLSDLALVELMEPVDTSSPAIGTACLPEKTMDYRGHENCILSGFGFTGFDAEGKPKLTDKLRLAVGQVWLQPAFKKAWNLFLGIIKVVGDTHIGFGGATTSGPSIGGCSGDSGGPLVCPNDAGIYSIAGVVSFGDRNCQTKPAVFTEVAKYREWIDETINKQQ